MPSFGILGLGGAVAFLLGSLMMFDSGVPGYRLPLGVVIGATLCSMLVIVAGIGALLRSRSRPPSSGGEALIGSVAVVERWGSAEGLVHLAGENWRAHSSYPLDRGAAVRVVGRRGLILDVEPVEKGRT